MSSKEIFSIVTKTVDKILSEGVGLVIALLGSIAIWYIMNQQLEVTSATFLASIKELKIERDYLLSELLECQKKQ